MKNYYEEKFDSLFTEFDPKKALEKIDNESKAPGNIRINRLK